MGFFYVNSADKKNSPIRVKAETLHKTQCRTCPLNRAKLDHPKMSPTGTDRPEIYILGGGPTSVGDQDGEPFVGTVQQLIATSLPRSYRNKVRYNNIIRCWVGKKPRNPKWEEIESCRPSIIKDIEKTKPKVVFLLGNYPLHWVIGEEGINKWRGRSIPAKIGNHSCWVFPAYDPQYIIDSVIKFKNDPKFSKEGKVFKNDFHNSTDYIYYDKKPKITNLAEVKKKVKIVTGSGGKEDLKRIKRKLNKYSTLPSVGLDIETNGLRPYALGRKILSIAVGTDEDVISFAIRHKDANWNVKELEELERFFVDWVLKSKCIKSVHNLAFELEWFGFFYGTKMFRKARWADSQGQAYIINEKAGMKSLDTLCLQYFGVHLKGYVPINVRDLDNEVLETVLLYNGLDSIFHHKLYKVQKKVLKKERLTKLYQQQLRRTPTLVLTQLKGLDVDQKAVKRHKKRCVKAIKRIKNKIAELPEVKKYKKKYRKQYEPGSDLQTVTIFKEFLGIEGNRSNANGFSVDIAFLNDCLKNKKIMKKTKLPRHLVNYRNWVKLESTYIDSFIYGKGKYVYPDKKAHPQYNALLTTTGRLSAQDFNTQNFTKKKNKWARAQIVAPKEHYFVSIDYGQIEARVIAMATKDKTLCDALWNRYDIHQVWAKKLIKAHKPWRKYNESPKEFKVARDKAKNKLVFPAFFGAQGMSIAGYLDMPVRTIDPLLKEFWDTFPRVAIWQKELLEFYNKHGYVKTLMGRRRHAPMSRNEAINQPIQGTASDIVIDSMNRLSEMAERDNRPQLQASLNIHDDLSFFLPKKSFKEDLKTIVWEMCKPEFNFINVPITIEVSVSKKGDWFHLKEYKEYSSDQL